MEAMSRKSWPTGASANAATDYGNANHHRPSDWMRAGCGQPALLPHEHGQLISWCAFCVPPNGNDALLESRHTVDFKALLLDLLIFSVPVWLLLQLFRTKNRLIQQLAHLESQPAVPYKWCEGI